MRGEHFLDVEQWRLLKQRSVEALLGDRAFLLRFVGVFVLVVGLVLGVIGLWGDVGSWGLLAMVYGVFWLGGVAGAGALVRERAMFERERMVAGLNVAAYLGGKLHSLSLLGVLAVVGYLPIVYRWGFWGMDEGMAVPVGWGAIVFLVTMVCGIGLGLMISALSHTVKGAQVRVGIVALVMFLVSGFGEGMFLGWISPLEWSRASLLGYGGMMPDEFLASGYLLVLAVFLVMFLAVAYVKLKRQGNGELWA